MKPSAVLFAYHQIGVNGLEALLNQGFDVRLVVTHQDDANETIWFDSVAETARRYSIPVICPKDPHLSPWIEQIEATQPDWLFSFYYRRLLHERLLKLPKQAALNLHGSLLPDYRGRSPVNWAVLNGETQTGVSLHRMEKRPDAGPIIDQQAVPIWNNDTAWQVMQKISVAAEIVLMRSLPRLKRGDWTEKKQDLNQGRYFGGRCPEDSRINWKQPAWQIHNLVRAVAPPYPPAFFEWQGHRFELLGSHYREEKAQISARPCLYWRDQRCYADCLDGYRFEILSLRIDQQIQSDASFQSLLGPVLFL